MFYARVALDLHLPVWIAQWALQPETEEAAPSACLLFGVVLLQDACCFPVAFPQQHPQPFKTPLLALAEHVACLFWTFGRYCTF